MTMRAISIGIIISLVVQSIGCSRAVERTVTRSELPPPAGEYLVSITLHPDTVIYFDVMTTIFLVGVILIGQAISNARQRISILLLPHSTTPR